MRNACLTGGRHRNRPRNRIRTNPRAFTTRSLTPLAFLLVLTVAFAHGKVEAAAAAGTVAPAVSIIIDDLGHRLDQDLRAIGLDGPVTCAFLPHTPHARRLAALAHARDKEVMLHLPMQAIGGRLRDEGGLRVSMSRRQFAQTVQDSLRALPHVRGVNNHMGSLLTQYPARMQWLMEELKQHGEALYFIDSFTTFNSVAYTVAAQNAMPTMRRDIFLDARRDPAFIERQFELLIRRARENGAAIAIGHPHPETMAFLEANLWRLAENGIELLPVSALIARRHALDDPRGGVVLAADHRSADNKPGVAGAAKIAN